MRFDLDANTARSPETFKKSQPRSSESDPSDDRPRKHRSSKRSKHREHRDRDRGEDSHHHRDSPQLMHDKYERPPSGVQRDDESEGTVELPDRFDEHGNRKEGGDGFESLLGSLASKFLGGSGGDDDEGRGGRSRHRH